MLDRMLDAAKIGARITVGLGAKRETVERHRKEFQEGVPGRSYSR